MEAIKTQYPPCSIVLTFFSPSGYKVKKDFDGADHIFYLPLDSKRHAQKFISIVQPQFALFVKYEFWYHYLHTLHQRQIPAILFSAIFQPRHPFFKWYGGLYRKMLGFYQQIFVQDIASLALLKQIDVRHVQIAGDTRFDRAAKILEQNRSFPSVAFFKGTSKLIVAGSTWREDATLLQQTLQQFPGDYKLLIAPHETDDATVNHIQSLFPGENCLWDANEDTLQRSRVCIVNTIGQLAYLYKYADAVWIGGGFTRSGIHNIIEPAVFGKPVFFGTAYSRYHEAVEMIRLQAAMSCADAEKFASAIGDSHLLKTMGDKASDYVHSQLGATQKIMHYLSEKCFRSIA